MRRVGLRPQIEVRVLRELGHSGRDVVCGDSITAAGCRFRRIFHDLAIVLLDDQRLRFCRHVVDLFFRGDQDV